MHGSISHIVNAQNLCARVMWETVKEEKWNNNWKCHRLEYQTEECPIDGHYQFYLPPSEMANALATIHITTWNTFTIILTWFRLTTFDLIISRRQFIFIIKICNNISKVELMNITSTFACENCRNFQHWPGWIWMVAFNFKWFESVVFWRIWIEFKYDVIWIGDGNRNAFEESNSPPNEDNLHRFQNEPLISA